MLPSVSADPISDKQAQAAQLATQINALGIKESGLSEQYDGAKLALDQATSKVNAAAASAAAAESQVTQDKASLKRAAQDAYVENGTQAAMASSSASTLTNAESGVVRAEYVNNLADSQAQAINDYQAAFQNAHDAQIVLKQAQDAAANTAQQLADDKQATIAAQDQLESTLSQVKGQLAQLVAQQQAAQAAAAARAAQQAIAAQRAAIQAAAARTQATVTSSASSSKLLPVLPSSQSGLSDPPVGSGAGAAVSAALSRVGLPYVWGASGPSSFDCSGLVMWAWAHAGVSLPHFSGAQYANTTHISMSDLQPGDLVFPRDPGEHVAMYIGGGNIVEAPFTGADVHVVALSSFFVYASRP
jgi:peptidoglycan DL-endopeptidase CwlO